MIEPRVAETLAAAAAATGVAGASYVIPRRRFPVMARRLGLGDRWVPIGAALVALALPAPRLVTVPPAVLVGSRIRRLGAARTIARRRHDMDREVPQLLDLLAAGSAAGLSASEGLRRSVDAVRGPLAQELRSALDAVDLGGRWREELAALTERLQLPDLRRAIVVLSRSETLGTSLTDATRELAADVRAARRASIAERARTAPVKMLFPLVLLILPAFLLLTVVPVLLTTVRSIQ